MAIPVDTKESALYQLEMNCLLDVIYQHYGYDYRSYAKRSVLSRLMWRKNQWRLTHLSEMIPLVLHSENHLRVLLSDLSITVTEMFREPEFFALLVEKIFPYLNTFPFFKIWHAGCATGEEVYSLAILLQEHGLYERAQIYATDMNPQALKIAKQGIYSQQHFDKHSAQYLRAGGSYKLDNYFHSGYGNLKIKDQLKNKIIFSLHNLVADGAFGVMELIICRNVLIYFNADLKARVIKLFNESLYHNGYLFLGSSESLNDSDYPEFKMVERKAKIYRKSPEFDIRNSNNYM